MYRQKKKKTFYKMPDYIRLEKKQDTHKFKKTLVHH